MHGPYNVRFTNYVNVDLEEAGYDDGNLMQTARNGVH